jgi:hypothetical protein
MIGQKKKKIQHSASRGKRTRSSFSFRKAIVWDTDGACPDTLRSINDETSNRVNGLIV